MSDDEFDDIEWEQESQVVETVLKDSPGDQTTVVVINPTGNAKEQQPNKKPRREQRKIYSDHDYDVCLSRSKKSTTQLFKHIVWTLENSLDRQLADAIVALVPDRLLHSCKQKNISPPTLLDIKCWMKNNFKIIASTEMTEDEGRDGSNTDELLEIVRNRKAGSLTQLYQLLLCLFTSLNIRCRLAVGWDMQSLSPSASIHQAVPALCCWLEVMMTSSFTSNSPTSLSASSSSNSSSSSSSDMNSSWMIVDLMNLQLVTGECPVFIKKTYKLDVIMALEVTMPLHTTISMNRSVNGMVCMLISARYHLRNRFTTLKLSQSWALYESWLQGLVDEYNTTYKYQQQLPPPTVTLLDDGTEIIDLLADSDEETDDINHNSKGGNTVIDTEREANQLRIIAQQQLQRLPTSFSGFKNHPMYLLKRHLLQQEIIHPVQSKAVALFKGETVYLQEQKETLRSKLQWRKFFRVVINHEVNHSIKTIKVRSRKTDGSDGFQQSEQKLYGKWQTEPIQVRPTSFKQ